MLKINGKEITLEELGQLADQAVNLVSLEKIGKYVSKRNFQLYWQNTVDGKSVYDIDYRHFDPEMFRSMVDNDGITYYEDYDDSCGCHPEYKTQSALVTWDEIRVLIYDYDNVMRALTDKVDDLKKRFELIQTQANEAKIKEKQNQEYLNYLKMKQKFEPDNSNGMMHQGE